MKTIIMSMMCLVSISAWADDNRPPPIGDFGAPIPGLTSQESALFTGGQALFQHSFTVAEGLGPEFNGPACTTCHDSHGVPGGGDVGTTHNVHHITIVHGAQTSGVQGLEPSGPFSYNGQTYLAFELGGPVEHQNSIAGMPGSGSCTMPAGSDPVGVPDAQVSIRHTPPVFGFGLLDAVPDEEILAFQGNLPFKRPGVYGAANWDVELQGLGRLLAFAFDITRTQPIGAPRVGRFGWHGSTGTLFRFSTEPFNIELGISTPFFPRENTSDGTTIQTHPECDLAPRPNDANSQQSLSLYYFQAFLAAPQRGNVTKAAIAGEVIFDLIGCADCHRDTLKTAPDYYIPLQDGTVHRVDALSGRTIHPYSDLLLHDMGPGLADQRSQGRASGRFWRTTPLWGFRERVVYLHDGRASSETDAILAHGGEGQSSTNAFKNLSGLEQKLVVDFLESL